jgi:subtilisin family serine protease
MGFCKSNQKSRIRPGRLVRRRSVKSPLDLRPNLRTITLDRMDFPTVRRDPMTFPVSEIPSAARASSRSGHAARPALAARRIPAALWLVSAFSLLHAQPIGDIRILLRPKAATGLIQSETSRVGASASPSAAARQSGTSDHKSLARYPRFQSASLDSLGRRFGARPLLRMCPWDSKEGTLILRFPRNGLSGKAQSQRALLDAYRSTGAFEVVEADGIGRGHGGAGAARAQVADPDDLFFIRQYGLKNTGTRSFAGIQGKAGADIEAVEAWGINPGSDSIIVAVLDGGLNVKHPDIAARVWVNAKEIPENGKDDDANGYIDDVNGWSFANNETNEDMPGSPDVTDGLGHGTNVAGIIGAIGGNGIGMAGVARCRIMPVKVLDDDNWGYYSWWAAGIRYAVDNGARILNLSLGGEDGNVTSLRSAVEYALAHNVDLVVSMGNERRAVAQYPAAFPGVIAVGATGPDDQWVKAFPWDTTKGSNFGSHISICAPGNIIYGLHYSNTGNYDSYWSGTSQAAPHVAGVCALLLAQDPARKPADLKRLLEAGAEDQVGDASLDTPGFDTHYGFGRLNALRSLKAGLPVAIRPLTRNRNGYALGAGKGAARDLLGRFPGKRPGFIALIPGRP